MATQTMIKLHSPRERGLKDLKEADLREIVELRSPRERGM